MDTEYVCMIPRNLNKQDGIEFGRFYFSWKQVGYLVVGGAVTYFSFTSGMPIVSKIATSILGFGTAVAFSFYKPKGAELDEVFVNSLIYTQRRLYYRGLEREGALVVTIKSKEEGNTISTKQKSFTLQSSKS